MDDYGALSSQAEAWRRLAAQGWLCDQPAEFQEALRACGEWATRPRGAALYHAGDPAEGVYGLLDGTLEVTAPGPGGEMVTLLRAGPGFWIGDSGLLSDQPRLVSVHAAQDCVAFFAPARDVRHILASRPEWWRCFYDLSHRNVALAVTLLVETLTLAPAARLARRMAALAGPDGEIRITQSEMAAVIGVNRSTVARLLAQLSEEGVVERRYGRLYVRDPGRLAAAGVGVEAI